MGLVDNIRMVQMFPTQANATGSGVFGTPQVRSNVDPFHPEEDPISQFAQRILPMIQAQENRQRDFKNADELHAQQQNLTNIGNAAAHPNVVLGKTQGEINPLDQAKLNQGQEKINSTDSRAAASLAEKQDYGKTVNGIRQQTADNTKAHNDAVDSINSFKATHPNMKLISPK